MLRIGLTGGIGSGKSLVSNVFRHLGMRVYVADTEAKRLMSENVLLIERIKELLGQEAYLDGELNTKFIAGKVFNDTSLLKGLNALVHPAVHEDFRTWSEALKEQPYVLEEAAILFESGGYRMMDYTVFVKAGKETRMQRVIARDGVSRQDVEARMKNQMEDSEKEKLADFIISNENNSMILSQIVDLHNYFLKLSK